MFSQESINTFRFLISNNLKKNTITNLKYNYFYFGLDSKSTYPIIFKLIKDTNNQILILKYKMYEINEASYYGNELANDSMQISYISTNDLIALPTNAINDYNIIAGIKYVERLNSRTDSKTKFLASSRNLVQNIVYTIKNKIIDIPYTQIESNFPIFKSFEYDELLYLYYDFDGYLYIWRGFNHFIKINHTATHITHFFIIEKQQPIDDFNFNNIEEIKSNAEQVYFEKGERKFKNTITSSDDNLTSFIYRLLEYAESESQYNKIIERIRDPFNRNLNITNNVSDNIKKYNKALKMHGKDLFDALMDELDKLNASNSTDLQLINNFTMAFNQAQQKLDSSQTELSEVDAAGYLAEYFGYSDPQFKNILVSAIGALPNDLYTYIIDFAKDIANNNDDISNLLKLKAQLNQLSKNVGVIEQLTQNTNKLNGKDEVKQNSAQTSQHKINQRIDQIAEDFKNGLKNKGVNIPTDTQNKNTDSNAEDKSHYDIKNRLGSALNFITMDLNYEDYGNKFSNYKYFAHLNNLTNDFIEDRNKKPIGDLNLTHCYGIIKEVTILFEDFIKYLTNNEPYSYYLLNTQNSINIINIESTLHTLQNYIKFNCALNDDPSQYKTLYHFYDILDTIHALFSDIYINGYQNKGLYTQVKGDSNNDNDDDNDDNGVDFEQFFKNNFMHTGNEGEISNLSSEQADKTFPTGTIPNIDINTHQDEFRPEKGMAQRYGGSTQLIHKTKNHLKYIKTLDAPNIGIADKLYELTNIINIALDYIDTVPYIIKYDTIVNFNQLLADFIDFMQKSHNNEYVKEPNTLISEMNNIYSRFYNEYHKCDKSNISDEIIIQAQTFINCLISFDDKFKSIVKLNVKK